MKFSRIYPKEYIIDDNNASDYAPIDGGRERPEGAKFTFSAQKVLSKRKKYPRSEWKERCLDREKRGRTLSQIVRKKRIPTSNQDGLNYCWTYGVVTAVNCKRAWRNMPYVEFSRESVAAPAVNYRNVGNWGNTALDRMIEVGIQRQSTWPRYYYRDNKYLDLVEAGQFKVLEFEILPDNDFDALFSALLDDEAVGVGYDWWSHEVCAIDPVVIGSNSFGVRIWNSWGDDYGDNGMAILSEGKATPQDAVIPITFMSE